MSPPTSNAEMPPPPSPPRMRYDLTAGRFQCPDPTCEFMARPKTVRIHADEEHGIAIKTPLLCPFCDLSFQTDVALSYHVSGTRGKCAPSELAQQRSLSNPLAAPRPVAEVAEVADVTEVADADIPDAATKPRTATAPAAGKGAIPRKERSKAKGTTSALDKTKTGKVTKSKPKAIATSTTRGTSQRAPTDPVWVCPVPVCARVFDSHTARSRHLYQNMREKECLHKILSDPELQQGLFLIEKPDEQAPTIRGRDKLHVGCPWCSCSYENLSGLRVHLSNQHHERYVNVIWLEPKEADCPEAIKLGWVPKSAKKPKAPATKDVVMKDENQVEGEEEEAEEEDVPQTTRPVRRSSRAKTARRIVPDDDEDEESETDEDEDNDYDSDSDTPLSQSSRARRSKRVSGAKAKSRQSTASSSPAPKTPNPSGPAPNPPAAVQHTCPFCAAGFVASAEFGQHLRVCMAVDGAVPGPSGAQGQLARPVDRASSAVGPAAPQEANEARFVGNRDAPHPRCRACLCARNVRRWWLIPCA